MSHKNSFPQPKHLALFLPVAVILAFVLSQLPIEAIRDRLSQKAADEVQSRETVEAQSREMPVGPGPELNLDAPLPDFSSIKDVASRKRAFFDFLLPRIQHANGELLKARQQISSLRERSRNHSLSIEEGVWLAMLATHYRVTMDSGLDDEFFKQLLRRVDVIPPSLILAQAANESGWGSSRFAREGNNLFGEYCYRPGCGLIPHKRPNGATFEVARYSSPYQSLLSYMNNLNRHDRYDQLRRYREQARQQGEPISGRHLAMGLLHYSERGEDYINELRSFIRQNKLDQLDSPLIAGNLEQNAELAPRIPGVLP